MENIWGPILDELERNKKISHDSYLWLTKDGPDLMYYLTVSHNQTADVYIVCILNCVHLLLFRNDQVVHCSSESWMKQFW